LHLLPCCCPATALLLPCYCPATALLPYCSSALLLCCPAALLLCCPAALLPCYCPAALLPYYCPTAIPSPLEFSNTSGYIIFVVVVSPSCRSNTESPPISVTLNSIIYSCPYVKTGIYKLTLIKLKDYPYNLFTVIAKHSRIRNCLLLIINSSSPSVEVSLI
jgi:hypothetical protein